MCIVLIFGEIIPSAILTGPNQLPIVSALLPLLYVVMIVLAPIAYPISWLLDWALGHGRMTVYNKTELSTMMAIQQVMPFAAAASIFISNYYHVYLYNLIIIIIIMFMLTISYYCLLGRRRASASMETSTMSRGACIERRRPLSRAR